MNKLIDDFSKNLSIVRRVTSSYNPKANGLVERLNQTITKSIKKMTLDHPQDWDRYIPYALMAYRTRVHSTTKFSPFQLLFGRKMNTFDNWTSKLSEEEELMILKRSVEIKLLCENDHKLTIANIQAAQNKQKAIQDKQQNASSDNLKPGDVVYTKSVKIQN